MAAIKMSYRDKVITELVERVQWILNVLGVKETKENLRKDVIISRKYSDYGSICIPMFKYASQTMISTEEFIVKCSELSNLYSAYEQFTYEKDGTIYWVNKEDIKKEINE